MTSNNKLRILALHGYRQSDVTFKAKIGSLRKALKKEVDFTFVRGPHKVPQRDDVNIEHTETNEYGWWFNNDEHTFRATVPSNVSVGFEESVAFIERQFKEHGPFDGLLGFSQGAAFVAILCAMQHRKMSPIRFDFAIIISGFKSLCAPHEIYYREEISLPSLHVYGETDQIIPTEMAEDLMGVFTDAESARHEGGHYVPGNKNLYKVFITAMIAGRPHQASTVGECCDNQIVT